MIVRWNLTRSLARRKAADVLVLSVGKSGRTWLRVMVNKYLSLRYGVPFEVGDLKEQDSNIPSLFYTHELWEHLLKTTPSQRLFGKYVIPDSVLFGKPVVVLHRDPRDVVVSLYFQMTKRGSVRVDMEMSEFVFQSKYGIDTIVQVLNAWRKRLRDHPRCHWVSYEALHGRPVETLLPLLEFLGLESVEPDMVRQAAEFAQFENMKKMEAKGEFGSKILRPGDASDPDSFKVREGRVGGFEQHFDEEQLQRLNRAMAQLDPFYGYVPER